MSETPRTEAGLRERIEAWKKNGAPNEKSLAAFGLRAVPEPDSFTERRLVYVYEDELQRLQEIERRSLSGSSDPDLVLVRKDSGGVFPDGTTNHAIEFGDSGSSDPEAVGLDDD